MSLAFDRSDWFSFDKAADVVCRHLSTEDRCAVHDSRQQRGLSGCVHYDCCGAGQRVTQELFNGRSWREHPELAAAMFAAFRVLKHVHEMLLLLDEAGRLSLAPNRAQRRAELLRQLEPASGWTAEDAASFDVARCQEDVHEFLRTLRDCVEPRRLLRRRRLPIVPGG